MGYDFHVVRTKNWLDAAKHPITKADYAICWNGEPVFVWYRGEITCKNPSNEHIVKLVQMADALGARVVGDDGERYELHSGTIFTAEDDE